MTVTEFLNYFNGIYCDYDGAYGDQCFDLANGYSRWIGGPRFTGATADLIINQAGSFYTRIDNAPNNMPQKGDVVVWNWPHVGIATGDNTDVNGFDALEQNDPNGSDCHLKHYNSYNGVLGWLRPNSLPIEDNRGAEADTNWNLACAIANALGTPVLPNDKATMQKDAVDEVNRLKGDLETEKQENITLNSSLTQLTTSNKDYATKELDAEKDRDLYKGIVNATAQALGCPPDASSIQKAIDDLKAGKPLPKTKLKPFLAWLVSIGINF